MAEATTLDKLVEVLKDFTKEFMWYGKRPEITGESRFNEDLKMDSLDRYEYHYRVEKVTGANIPEEVAADFVNARDYATYVDKQRQPKV